MNTAIQKYKSKAIIYGCGNLGRAFVPLNKVNFDFVCYLDQNAEKINSDPDFNDKIPVMHPDALLSEINEIDFDIIIIAIENPQINDEVKQMLTEKYNVPPRKFRSYHLDLLWISHKQFLRDMAEMIKKQNIKGDIAECGVWQGETACFLNQIFPERMLYLFDTFEGFVNEKDVKRDEDKYDTVRDFIQQLFDKHEFKNTSAELVMNRMEHPEKVVIKKGYFPDTWDEEVKNKTYAFVKLDTDLYKPIKDGLELFYPQMSKHGCILIHDYFYLEGVAEAVHEWHKNHPDAIIAPIGDGISIAVYKT
jgi:O-methyltransferase